MLTADGEQPLASKVCIIPASLPGAVEKPRELKEGCGRRRRAVNKAAVLPRCEGDTGMLHTVQALLINHRIFTSSDLIKGRRNSHAHAALGGVNLSAEAIVLSPLKQNKLRSDTQHMSFDIKPYGRGAERAIYLKVVAVIGRKNMMGLLPQ